MPEPAVSVHKLPSMPRTAHPLAHKSGVIMIGHMIEATTVWRHCTPPQRALLSEVCPPLVALALERQTLDRDDMPVVGARSQMLAALRRRGLVDDEDRLTGKALHTYYWAHWPPPQRPVIDVQLPGEA